MKRAARDKGLAGRIHRQLKRDAADLVDFAAAMMRIPTENPPGTSYAKCAALIASRLRQLGLTIHALERAGFEPAGRIVSVSVPDEETSGPRGTVALAAAGLIEPDAVGMLTMEPTGGDRLECQSRRHILAHRRTGSAGARRAAFSRRECLSRDARCGRRISCARSGGGSTRHSIQDQTRCRAPFGPSLGRRAGWRPQFQCSAGAGVLHGGSAHEP